MKTIALLAAIIAMPAYAGPCNRDMLSVAAWSIEPIDAETNWLKTEIKSTSDKPIRMIDAMVSFQDALGGSIASFEMNRDASIPAGGAVEETGRWGRYTFERLLNLRHDEVTTSICVKAVVYEDGTIERFDAQ